MQATKPRFVLSKPILDGEILSFNPAKLAQLLPERVHEDRATRSSAWIQVTDAEDFRWVLRVGGEAKSQDESGKNKANNFFIHFSLFRLPPHGFLIHLVRSSRAPLARRRIAGYTAGMKTAISIPDKLFADAERFSRRHKKSRSRLYVEAVEEYLAHHDPDSITEAINEVCKTVDTRPDPGLSAASRRTLKRVEW